MFNCGNEEPDSPKFRKRRHPYGRRGKKRRTEILLLLTITVDKNGMKNDLYKNEKNKITYIKGVLLAFSGDGVSEQNYWEQQYVFYFLRYSWGKLTTNFEITNTQSVLFKFIIKYNVCLQNLTLCFSISLSKFDRLLHCF